MGINITHVWSLAQSPAPRKHSKDVSSYSCYSWTVTIIVHIIIIEMTEIIIRIKIGQLPINLTWIPHPHLPILSNWRFLHLILTPGVQDNAATTCFVSSFPLVSEGVWDWRVERETVTLHCLGRTAEKEKANRYERKGIGENILLKSGWGVCSFFFPGAKPYVPLWRSATCTYNSSPALWVFYIKEVGPRPWALRVTFPIPMSRH